MIVGKLVIDDEVVVINWVVPTSKNEENIHEAMSF